MYEYTIQHKATGEIQPIFGYTYIDACKRWKIDVNDYYVIHKEYID